MGARETFFIAHSDPLLTVDDSLPAKDFLKSWREQVFTQKPKSILLVSAHWETDVPTVNLVHHYNNLIYDFDGLPQQFYQLKYPAPGAPELGKRVKELLTKSSFKHVNEDRKRMLDHGAWVPLMLMYPEANIPVCQLSIQPEKDGSHHYNLGKALAPLKDEGVLIIGSGSPIHNLSLLEPESNSVAAWALEFDNWLNDALLQGRYEDVKHYEEKAPHAKMAHPQPEHFYPLHVAIGAAGENSRAQQIHQSWEAATYSYASYRFTAAC